MNTHHLKYFHDCLALNSVHRAATLNSVTPSAISQAVRSLELELNMKLTEKQKGKLLPTAEAHSILKSIKQILAEVEALKEHSNNNAKSLQGTLRLATHQSLLSFGLWRDVRRFKNRYPAVEVVVSTSVGSQIANLVNRSLVDLAITLDMLNVPGIDARVLKQDYFMLVGRKSRKLNKESPALITDRRKPEITYLLKRAPWLNAEEEIPSWSTIRNVILQEDAFGYLPHYVVRGDLAKGILTEAVFAKKLRYAYTISASFASGRDIDPLIGAFLSNLSG